MKILSGDFNFGTAKKRRLHLCPIEYNLQPPAKSKRLPGRESVQTLDMPANLSAQIFPMAVALADLYNFIS
jgi:hypothetical protein